MTASEEFQITAKTSSRSFSLKCRSKQRLVDISAVNWSDTGKLIGKISPYSWVDDSENLLSVNIMHKKKGYDMTWISHWRIRHSQSNEVRIPIPNTFNAHCKCPSTCNSSVTGHTSLTDLCKLSWYVYTCAMRSQLVSDNPSSPSQRGQMPCRRIITIIHEQWLSIVLVVLGRCVRACEGDDWRSMKHSITRGWRQNTQSWLIEFRPADTTASATRLKRNMYVYTRTTSTVSVLFLHFPLLFPHLLSVTTTSFLVLFIHLFIHLKLQKPVDTPQLLTKRVIFGLINVFKQLSIHKFRLSVSTGRVYDVLVGSVPHYHW